MTIYVLRHAEKAKGDFHNPTLRHQDQPISENGELQARRLVQYFEGKDIEAIYVSEYIRTKQTIAYAAEKLQLSPVIDGRLNELDNGDVDQMTEDDLRVAYPDVWKAYVARTADFRFPGGETGEEAQMRIRTFLEEKTIEHAGKNFIVVCHDGLIRLMMCYIMGIPVYRRGDFKVDLCGITEIAYQEDVQRWKLLRYNQVLG